MMQSPKGTRDFLPQEKIVRQELEAKLKRLFELYGYNPLETPAFELFETLSSKYAGGAEILKETYSFEDQGKRKFYFESLRSLHWCTDRRSCNQRNRRTLPHVHLKS